MKPYSVMTPPYNPTSGGIKVMWGLYGWLLSKGQTVYVNAQYDNNDFVAIYPEIYRGNPANAKHVVRYILQKPGMMGSILPTGQFQSGPVEFDKNDKIYVFSRMYDTWGVDDDHVLFLPIINTYLFKDQKKKRTMKAFYVGKGNNLNTHPAGAFEITREFASDQQALADLLNKCQALYCYDPATAMTEIARLCGCRVVISPSWFTKEQFELYEPGMNGISWGEDNGVKLDAEAFRNHYMSLKKIFEERLDKFIYETQKD